MNDRKLATTLALVQTGFRDRLTELLVEMNDSNSLVDVDIAFCLIMAMGTHNELKQLSDLAKKLYSEGLDVNP